MSDFTWATDRLLSDESAAGVIASRFPKLAPVTITGRAEGCDNQAVEINGEWIFRFPKRREGQRELQKELNLLPHLAPFVPAPIPEYCFIGSPDPGFPYLFAGYRKLPGTPALDLPPETGDAAGLADRLGSILSLVHAFPAEDAARLGVQPLDEDARLPARREAALAVWEQCRSEVPADVYFGARRLLDDIPPEYPGPLLLLHGDFSAEHILLDPVTGAITGIIDWTDAYLGDPASDLDYLWVWRGDAFIDAILGHYSRVIDPGLRTRTRFGGLCTAMHEVHYGLHAPSSRNLHAGLSALRRSLRAEE